MASEKAIAVISKLLEHTTTKPIPEGNLDTWVKVLEPLEDELAVAATLRVVRSETKPFAVPPGAIYQAALAILREKHPSSGEAWAMVNKAITYAASREGMWDGERFAEIHALPDMVREAAEQTGIMAMVHGSNPTADRARFLEFYREVVNQRARGMLALSDARQEALKKGEE